MGFTEEQLEENFTEAANHWNLEKLYLDLALAKGRSLTPVEKKFLRGLLCGYSPAEIAAQVYKSPTSSAVRVYLSNGLYKYIQELLNQQGETAMPIKNWSRVTNLLEKAGYKLEPNQLPLLRNGTPQAPQSATQVSQSANPNGKKYQQWQGAIDIDVFQGRQNELTQLEQWIVKDSCRLIAIVGMGGIGKTALAVKLAQQTQHQFEGLIWRSLASAPPLEIFLEDLIQSLSQGQDTNLPVTVEGKISRLMAYLRGSSGEATALTYQYLLVLDQVEAILQPQLLAGVYREGYEDYGQLFRRLGEERHRSCCLLLSREKPRDIASMAGAKLPVRTFQLSGLKTTEGILLLHAKGQRSSEDKQQLLLRLYGSNPLVLKIIATALQDLFEGSITEFLAEGTIIFGDIRALLDEQFARLSDLERQVMYSLAVYHKPVRLFQWPVELAPGVSKRERLDALESLQRRALIEKTPTGFTLQPMVKIYVAQTLSEQIAQEITIKEVASFKDYLLMDSLLKDDQASESTLSKGISH